MWFINSNFFEDEFELFRSQKKNIKETKAF